MKSNLKIAIFYIVLIGVIIIATATLFQSMPREEVTFSDVVSFFKDEQVKEFVIDEDNVITMSVRVVLPDGSETTGVYTYELRNLDLFLWALGDTVNDQYERGIIESYNIPAPTAIPWWVAYLPYVIITVLLIAVWIFVMNQTMGGKFYIGDLFQA